jgi:hypothetical protein
LKFPEPDLNPPMGTLLATQFLLLPPPLYLSTSPPSGPLSQLVWLHLVILLHTHFLVFLLLYSIKGTNLHKLMTRSETSKNITHLQFSYSAAP